jgi:hypothetical protein
VQAEQEAPNWQMVAKPGFAAGTQSVPVELAEVVLAQMEPAELGDSVVNLRMSGRPIPAEAIYVRFKHSVDPGEPQRLEGSVVAVRKAVPLH